MQELDTLIDLVTKEGASDLHIAEGRPPLIRVSGSLIPLSKVAPFSKQTIEKILSSILTDARKRTFDKNQSVDFAYLHSGQRFRSHAYISEQKVCMAFRHIPTRISTLKELNLPDTLENFARMKAGFFLVVGPTGHGKSTTLASLVELINTERLENIVTVEDPIEYVFTPNKSVIHQREVGIDTPDFHQALHDAFREDINVLMVGEMRDAETIGTTVTAAETGHLVFSTLHTNNAAQTVDRIIDSFAPDQQSQIRMQLASSLTGIFSQRLVPRISGGLVPVYELLINNNAVANLIRDKRTHEINTVIETSAESGMVDFNRCLVEKVRAGEVSIENAYLYSTNPKTLEKML